MLRKPTAMKLLFIFFFLFLSWCCLGQDYYDLARKHFLENNIDSARFFINRELREKPTADDYFLSGMIHESENKSLRALADYEAVVKYNPENLEAYFQKGLIYFHSASTEKAVDDFTFVIDNHGTSKTNAVYFGNDPYGRKGTFVTSLQSMVGHVYQYRAQAYQKLGDNDRALNDFNKSFEYDTLADFYINRSHLYSQIGNGAQAISDLRSALKLEPENYLAWYNLALLDEQARLPASLINNEEFTPILNLLGANAFESEDYETAIKYLTKAIENDLEGELAYLNRGKAFLKTGQYRLARIDFLKALQTNSRSYEAFYLVGNSFFYEKNYEDALGFYERYLSVDQGFKNAWYNAAMAYLSNDQEDRGCECLKKAEQLGMDRATVQIEKHCETQ